MTVLNYDELTAVERTLWDSFREGRQVDLRTGVPADDDPGSGEHWGPERRVRAEVVAALLLGGNPEPSSAVASLRLTGALITGRLDLAGAEINHLLWLRECRLEQAVSLDAASTRTVRITSSRVPGVDAGLARIEGHLDLNGSVMETGRLSLINARVTGELDLNGARISASREWAVFAGGLVMGGGVFCQNGFVARGGVRLLGAQLPGGLFMRGARLENPGGMALLADNMTSTVVDTLDFGLAAEPAGAVDLQGAGATVLHDRKQSRPREVRLDGFVYGSLRSDRTLLHEDVAHRLAWIRRSPGYAPQPYEQLAACYRQAGHDDDARRVLLEKQRHHRRTLNPPGRVWGYLLDAAVGYGYRPWLSALWMTTLWLLGSLVFSARSPVRTKSGEGAPFNPFVYTIDLLFPIGDFGQRGAWHWTGATQWLAYLLIAIGRLLTTAVVAGISRTLNRN